MGSQKVVVQGLSIQISLATETAEADLTHLFIFRPVWTLIRHVRSPSPTLCLPGRKTIMNTECLADATTLQTL